MFDKRVYSIFEVDLFARCTPICEPIRAKGCAIGLALRPMPPLSRRISFRGPHHDAIVSNRPVLADHWATVRFPLDLRVRFRSISGSLVYGAGRVVNVSSSGVLVVSPHIVTEHEIGVGVHLEVSIEWPLSLDGRIPLQLFVTGWVVRRGELLKFRRAAKSF
jgi:hypothetical protein